MPLVTSLLVMLAVTAAEGERSPAPASVCIDARAVLNASHPTERVILVQSEGQAYRIDLAESCAVQNSAAISLIAAEGWVCGLDNEFAMVGAQVCAVEAVSSIDSREYAQTLRKAEQARGIAVEPTLAGVEVRGTKKLVRGFAGSYDYCFHPNHVRGWNSTKHGVVIETNPLRSGGHRYYRLDLGRSCPELDIGMHAEFDSAPGIGWICGNPGDMVRSVTIDPPILFEGDFGLTRANMLSSRGGRQGCPIMAVYPVASPSAP